VTDIYSEDNLLKKVYITVLGALLVGMVFAGGCAGGEDTVVAKEGDTVKVHYTGKLEDGSVFDSSENRDPLEFTIGAGTMIIGFNNAVVGMKVGEQKTVTIPSAEAYGESRDDLIAEMPRTSLAPGVTPVVGQQMQVTLASGGVITAVVIAVSETTVTIDANHSLAGKDLIFEIELVEIGGVSGI
jgi:peptidylprolyl isomerase